MGPERSSRVTLEGEPVERVGCRQVTVMAHRPLPAVSACISAMWGLCFWKEPTLGIQKMVPEKSLGVILRRIQINFWMPEGGSGRLEPVWAPLSEDAFEDPGAPGRAA